MTRPFQICAKKTISTRVMAKMKHDRTFSYVLPLETTTIWKLSWVMRATTKASSW
jgi:hypothetical protein